jgi:protein involved in polysaccharide export with SLBB domain
MRSALVLFVLSTAVFSAFAQVPLPMQEQIELFNSLPPAQQQALIRELQQNLPPAQRQAVLGILQGQNRPSEPPDGEPRSEAPAPADRLQPSQLDLDALLQLQVPRLRPNDTVVIQLDLKDPPPPSSPFDQQTRDDFRERLEAGNPYNLDRAGQLFLPGVAAIRLAGLNVEEATVRIATEPLLRSFVVTLTRLPLEPVGTEALKPYGYDLFDRPRSSFTPPSDLPVPVDYVVGPGDSVNIQLFGNNNAEYFQTVSREGSINLPQIGPVNVAGLTFDELRNAIALRVDAQLIGTRASVTLGELRSIRVFVLGDVERPGSYTIGGFSTITNALFASGGVAAIGSLRNIALMREGERISTLDLYDLLLRGDTRADTRLQPGDAIFVPPIGPTVAIDGEVRRPAIYELRDEATVAAVLELAGGLNADANRSAVKLERIVPNRGTMVEDVDLSGGRTGPPVRDGDVVRVQPNLPQLEDSVRLLGNVFQPGLYEWVRGMRLLDLLPAPEVVKPMSDLGYVLIRREIAANVATEVFSADLADAWRRPAGPNNVVLEPRDTIHVFNLETGRTQYIEPIVREFEAQMPPNAPLPVVRIGGQVRAPGEYPLEPDMRVSDLLRAGAGLNEAAYATEAELTRYAIVDGEYRETELMRVDLAALLRGDAAADVRLTAHDFLNIKEVSRWRGEETVTLRGEVVFPGDYPIRRGETLSSVLARAGGVTELAFLEGSVFTRVELRDRQREQLEVLATRIERDLAAISISDPNAAATITTGQSLISQLRNTVATGRLVIRLDDLVADVPGSDVILKDGDVLIVPDQRHEVTVLGEVQYATSHIYELASARDDYIEKSGGLTQRADRKRIYVVRANGEVMNGGRSRWFSRGFGDSIRPGDTIVVPLDVGQPLARWSAITQIVYNLAIAAAAVQSF